VDPDSDWKSGSESTQAKITHKIGDDISFLKCWIPAFSVEDCGLLVLHTLKVFKNASE